MSNLTNSDINEIRHQFPALDRFTYFATNGLGVLPQRTVKALGAHLDGLLQNAILAALSQDEALLDETRARVARLLGCDPQEVAFCRNTSEGVLWTAASLRLEPGDEVLVPQGEYPANVLPWMAQETRGVVTRLLQQHKRRVTPELVAAAWSPRTRVLAISFVQYNSGFRADLQALARVVHERGGLLFCDAIQGLGALRLNVRETGVDVLAAGTHKWLLGLQGLGIFFCRRELLKQLESTHVATGSLIHDQDPEDPDAPYDRAFVDEARRYEEGSRNYVGLTALNESLHLIEEIGIERIETRVGELTNYLVREAEKRGCRVESPRGPSEWSGIVLFAPPPGAASASELVAAMHAQGITINAREGCIHMGVHFYNTYEEIDRVLGAVDR